MSKKKKIIWVFVALLVVIQFIRPTKNLGEVYTNDDISHSVNVPDDIKNILEKSCYDCHSNNTNYPWYTNIQPVGWWLNYHVNEGLDELNFSKFNTYKLRRKLKKLEEISKQIKEQEMPLSSYTLIHKNAILTEKEQNLMIQWALNNKALLDTVKIASAPQK